MKVTKITEGEIQDLLVSSLPTRPTAPASFGGRGFTASEMKAAFDALPLYIKDRLNLLIDSISSSGDDSLSRSIQTGINDDYTLFNLCEDIVSGNILNLINFDGESLYSFLARVRNSID